eukprot:1091247-Pelagomonas_calceolata.AAC.2
MYHHHSAQIMTLETIARARHLGALQSNLASKMNITNANFFYVVKRPTQTSVVHAAKSAFPSTEAFV